MNNKSTKLQQIIKEEDRKVRKILKEDEEIENQENTTIETMTEEQLIGQVVEVLGVYYEIASHSDKEYIELLAKELKKRFGDFY